MIGGAETAKRGGGKQRTWREKWVYPERTIYAWKAKYGGMEVSQAQEGGPESGQRSGNTACGLDSRRELDRDESGVVIRRKIWDSVVAEAFTQHFPAGLLRYEAA